MRRSYLSSPHGVRRFGIHERGAVAAPRGSRPDAAADAVEDGTVTFLADGLPVTFAAGDDGSVGASGSNFFTLLADPGVSTFTITSTVAFNLVDVAQVRVGELSTTVIPLPAAAWSGMVLLGLLGGQRALRRLRQR